LFTKNFPTSVQVALNEAGFPILFFSAAPIIPERKFSLLCRSVLSFRLKIRYLCIALQIFTLLLRSETIASTSALYQHKSTQAQNQNQNN
jgi:hypothetical protein